TNGLLSAYAIAFAYETPTSSDPIKPGPIVTAIPSTFSLITLARTEASSTMVTILSRCSRDASSGTTPPNRSCVLICEAMTEERIAQPSRTTAAAVSSQDVSMPSTNIVLSQLSVVSCNDSVAHFSVQPCDSPCLCGE